MRRTTSTHDAVLTTEKHLVNDPSTLVVDSLKGLATLNPTIQFDEAQRVIYRSNTKNRVALLSGGGSGHEPAHAGFVVSCAPSTD